MIQSFRHGEVDFDTAHQIDMELADKVLEGKYSYMVITPSGQRGKKYTE